MGKSTYLKGFQKNLRQSIEDLICKEWGYDYIMVNEEDSYLPGHFNGQIDISICNKDPEKDNIILGIEIEHKSDAYQAKKNITKLKDWTHNSVNRSASLMHIINEECNIKHDTFGEIVRYAKENEHKNNGFFYDFIYYKVDDNKKTKQIPEDLVQSKEFQTRLWMLIENCGLL